VEAKTIEEYILGCPEELQERLNKLRRTIREAAPDATEKISWRMPTFVLYGNLVHFAAFKKHIGFYPGASGIENFKEKISKYKNSKGAVQFPNDKPIPFELITEIVKFRVRENIKEYENKSKK
jgi:uncharacterized protein YdhG (YjbR/CyaY superfamily)